MSPEPNHNSSQSPSRISPLARRIVIYTISFSTLVALLSTAIQLYIDYRRELTQVESTFQQITHTTLPTVASALWTASKQEIQIAVEGLSRMPDVHYAAVTEKHKLWAESGSQTSKNVSTRVFDLKYLYRNQLEKIGELTVAVDMGGIYQRLLNKFWVILVANGIKTFIVSGFMLWLFHSLVTRHLRHIARFASRLGYKNLNDRLQLYRKPQYTPDEFDLVLNGLNRMQQNLSSTLHELEHDIAERKLVEERLKLFASVFKYSHQGIMVTDAKGKITDVNPAFSQITGYLSEEIIGQNLRVLRSERQDKKWYTRMWQALTTNGHWHGEIWNRRKNGETYPEQEDISAIYNDKNEIINYVAIFSDISQQKFHEAELDRIAHYDLLTNLPNRRLLIDRLEQALPRTRRDNKLLAIAYLDLDGFKAVNDRYGHAAGDKLLVKMSHRLKNTLRGEDTLARLGGDEFVMLIGDLDHIDSCAKSLNRALAAIKKPIIIDGIQMDISGSIGVTLYPLDDDSGGTLLRHADQAMYMAKQAGKNCFHLFDANLDQEQQDFMSQIHDFNNALINNEFIFHHQPKVNLLSGELLGVEALIRWQHPERGLLPPGAFLAVIDNHSLEVDLGKWVIESALIQLETWNRESFITIISVNISAYHLLHPSFVTQLVQLLKKYPSVNANQLELEVLETTAMGDINHAIDVMAECKALGLHISLDDFGTGYSSLTYFRRFPVDTIKIDRSFIHDMDIDKGGMAIVKSIVQLAELFERSCIAEGIETKEQAEALIKLGCSNVQGYYIARPMPPGEIAAWLKRWNTLPRFQPPKEENNP